MFLCYTIQLVNEKISFLEDTNVGQYAQEINKRRTFAIISHPDAGKTTLTD